MKRTRNKMMLAVGRAIIDKLTDGNWQEVGYLTDSVDQIGQDQYDL